MQLGQRETRVVVFKYRNLSEMTYHDTKGKKKRSEIKKKKLQIARKERVVRKSGEENI